MNKFTRLLKNIDKKKKKSLPLFIISLLQTVDLLAHSSKRAQKNKKRFCANDLRVILARQETEVINRILRMVVQ